MQKIEYIDRKTKRKRLEVPPGERYLRFLYCHPSGKLPLHLLVKRKLLSSLYGKIMNSSISAKRIARFVRSNDINMEESQRKVNDFGSFNEFFSRELKVNSRAIEKNLVSPADGKIIAFENIERTFEFFVKGDSFELASFLQDAELAAKYKHHSLILVRLAPSDYHRFHFPCAGTISKINKIEGSYFSVSPFATRWNFAKVFCQNKREYAVLQTKDKGEILIAPVGATMVGTIVETYRADSSVERGAEMGYFAFGGSSVLMLVNKKFKIDQDVLDNTKKGLETSIRMGERIGE